MPTARLNRRPWWAHERPDRVLVLAATAFTAGAVATVLGVAAVVWALAPSSWQGWIEDEQRTDASAVTVISIWTNNLLICCLPVLAGVFAHRLVGLGRSTWARVVVIVAAVAVVRSPLIIGLVGGLDPTWLAETAAWWVAEVTALATCCAAGWQAYRDADPTVVSRRLAQALGFAGVVLGMAAGVEVALT